MRTPVFRDDSLPYACNVDVFVVMLHICIECRLVIV